MKPVESKINILTVDDDTMITNKLHDYFYKRDFNSYVSDTISGALNILNKNKIDICFLDIILGNKNGIELLKEIRKNKNQIEVIMISGHGNMDLVIESMRLGATDFLKKPFSNYELNMALERTKRFVEIQNLLETTANYNSLLFREIENSNDLQLIGDNKEIKEALKLAYLAGQDNNINVLITGENGTGKEIIARLIHYSSPRKDKPFHPVNSTAFPETLLESEFFGHKKGSFTDAREDKKGLLEMADGSTLFLDEIADMPITLQSKLLRVLEEKTVRPIGSDKSIRVDTRIISATNRNIENLILENKFRKDLYHRINTLEIYLPPLRERTNDIKPLTNYFINYFAKMKKIQVPHLDSSVLSELKKYSFPGNVRELKNMVERALLICKNHRLQIDDFFGGHSPSQIKRMDYPDYNLDRNEKKLIEAALVRTDFKQVLAAAYLGISRDSLLRRLKKFNISINKKFDD